MKRLYPLLSLLMLLLPGPGSAATTADAREIARINNCTPKKIEVYEQTLGARGETVYKVDCTLPKMVGSAPTSSPDAILVSCVGSLCELIRPLESSKKQ